MKYVGQIILRVAPNVEAENEEGAPVAESRATLLFNDVRDFIIAVTNSVYPLTEEALKALSNPVAEEETNDGATLVA